MLKFNNIYSLINDQWSSHILALPDLLCLQAHGESGSGGRRGRSSTCRGRRRWRRRWWRWCSSPCRRSSSGCPRPCSGPRRQPPRRSASRLLLVVRWERRTTTRKRISTLLENGPWELVGNGLRHRFSNRFPPTETNCLVLGHWVFNPVP